MNRPILLVAIITVLFFAGQPYSQWAQTGGISTNTVQALLVHNGYLFAGTYGGGVFHVYFIADSDNYIA
jgi:hypothetical protein